MKEIPFLWMVGFMMTYKCTIACKHCIVKAGPNRKEEMLENDAIYWIDQVSKYDSNKIKGISFTGGEPFYNFEYLKRITDYTNSKGLFSSVVTNGFWAKTKKDATLLLSKLKGVKYISISTDTEHLKFIPLNNLRNIVWSAKKLDIHYNISLTANSKESKEYINIYDRILEFTEKENIQTAITIPLGRALNKNESRNYKISDTPNDSACTMANFPIIFPNGNVIGCIGSPIAIPPPHPLFLGNLKKESLNNVFKRAEKNHILHCIRVWGPYELVNLLKKHNLENLLPKKYISDMPCDVCRKLFSNNRINDILEDLSNKNVFKEKVAYGRLYYLNEDEAVKELLSEN